MSSRIGDTVFGTIMNLIISFSSYCIVDRVLVGLKANTMLMYGTTAIHMELPPYSVHTNPLLSTAGFVFIIVFGLLTKWDAHYIVDESEIKEELNMVGLMKNIMENMPDDENPEQGDVDTNFEEEPHV